MFRGRRWLAGLLVVVFSAVEIFGSAPQLHFHSRAKAQTAVLQRVATQSGRSALPNDCVACRAFGIATTLISSVGVTPPIEHQSLILTATTLLPASEAFDDARGRAPPAR
jgi:hypothetical protein